MTCTEYVIREIEDLLRKLSCRKFDYAVDNALAILQDQFGARFYRVTDWPEEMARSRSNFVIIRGVGDVQVSLADPGTIAALVGYGLALG